MPAEVVAQLESPLPATLPAGVSTVLCCIGWAHVGGAAVASLELVLGGVAHPALATAMPRSQLPVRRSGFWGLVPVPAAAAGSLTLTARIRTAADEVVEIGLGSIELVAAAAAISSAAPDCAAAAGPPAAPGPAAPATASATAGRIAICMATFDPDPELLSRQLDSIRAQTERDWVCVISDDGSPPEAFARIEQAIAGDDRFTLSPAPGRIGFYRNFERALMLGLEHGELLALADQDDVWHPDKLSSLRAALPGGTLAYSDMRLVDERGGVIADTLWRWRANNWTSLASMLFANTVTGAAALVPRATAELALPFPDAPGVEFHDHWLALVALAAGELRYVPRPLYDYVQHSGAILGKLTDGGGRTKRPTLRANYFLGLLPSQQRAAVVLLRCGDRLTPRKRRALELMLACDRSPLAFAWLLARPLRALAGRSETLGGEWDLARGALWVILARLLARVPGLPERLLLDASFPDPPVFEQPRLRRWRARIAQR